MFKIEYQQIDCIEKDKTTIHIDLYVDESKNRIYNNPNGENEKITYIMIMAIPKDKKEYIYNKLNNARCTESDKSGFAQCKNNCQYHDGNNKEIHYTELSGKNNRFNIASRWIDILLENNLNDERAIYFNILGVVESNLDMSKFGTEGQFGNLYTRFFRTCLLRVLTMFKKYDEIIVENIFHDKTTEMELHPYFDTSAIMKIRIDQLIKGIEKVKFSKSKIEFIDSNHKKDRQIDSQFIQFVDVILGSSLNVIHATSNKNCKKELSYKIKPLIERILSNNNIFAKKRSRYNYFNRQSISFFPVASKISIKKEIKPYYSNDIDIDSLLKDGNNFCNSKPILLKEESDQLDWFDLIME